MLADAGYSLLLETSGSITLEGVDPRVKIIMDIKTPTSGESSKNLLSNIALLKPNLDEVKFVVESKEDFEFAKQITLEYSLLDQFTVLISPSFGKVTNITVANWVLASGLPFRMQLQMHKYIWDPETQGV
jgi:7-carboxy-7-deazaguanine synthase